MRMQKSVIDLEMIQKVYKERSRQLNSTSKTTSRQRLASKAGAGNG